jgi:hypothetical protein
MDEHGSGTSSPVCTVNCLSCSHTHSHPTHLCFVGYHSFVVSGEGDNPPATWLLWRFRSATSSIPLSRRAFAACIYHRCYDNNYIYLVLTAPLLLSTMTLVDACMCNLDVCCGLCRCEADTCLHQATLRRCRLGNFEDPSPWRVLMAGLTAEEHQLSMNLHLTRHRSLLRSVSLRVRCTQVRYINTQVLPV